MEIDMFVRGNDIKYQWCKMKSTSTFPCNMCLNIDRNVVGRFGVYHIFSKYFLEVLLGKTRSSKKN